MVLPLLPPQVQGRNWVILRGGHRYIYNRKNEIINVLAQVLNVLHLYVMSFGKV